MKKYILSLLACFLLFASAQAIPEAEFIKIGKDYTFHPDGSYEIRYTKQLKINTHIALNNLYGETFVIYNPEYQSVAINSSYTVQADGTIIKTPENAFNEVLPSNAADAPAYNHLRELVITHTGLEIGATIFLDYTLKTKAGYLPAGILPETDDILEESSPVKEYTLTIGIPASLSLNYTLTASKVKPKITEKGEMKQYTWQFKNIPAASHESKIPDSNIPQLTTSCYDSQITALKALYGNHFNDQPDETVKNKVKELTGGKKNDLEKIMAIQQFVAGQIAFCRLPLEQAGYTTRTPAEVLNTAYGTDTEKNRLLAGMLRAMGEKPEIVVLYPAHLQKGIKGLNAINSYRIKVDNEGKPIFISALFYPTPSLELSGHQKNIWMISDTEILPLNIVENNNSVNYKANIQLTPEKATVSGRFIVKGGMIATMDTASTRNYISNLCSQNGKITASQLHSTDRRNADMNFSAEKDLSPAHGYLLYELPNVNTGVKTWYLGTLNSSRKKPYELSYPITENYTYTITLTPEMALKTKATNIDMNKPFGKLHISITPNGNNVTVNKEIQLHKTILSPSEYQDFRTMYNIWNDKNYNTLLIQTAGQAK